MALFFECMEQCAQKVLDAADIVRDGDFSPIGQQFHRLPTTIQEPLASPAPFLTPQVRALLTPDPPLPLICSTRPIVSGIRSMTSAVAFAAPPLSICYSRPHTRPVVSASSLCC